MLLKTTPSQMEPFSSPFFAFSREDRQTALLCFFIALITFWWTAMPNIGLGDDGEMATAALHMGVPHPSGYPLWTILGGLFVKLIPFGNGSWKLNLFSGLCAASAVAIFTLLARSTVRWLGMKEKPATLLSIAGALTFAWSVPVWSQATIGKGTYSLHVLLMLTLTALCYLWIRTPLWKNAFVWIVFSFALGMSNHHMTLAMAVLPLLVILLLHGDLFWEYTVYSLLIGSGLYVGFAALSSLPDAMKAALRFFLTMSCALVLLIAIKKKLTEWKRGLLLVLAVVLSPSLPLHATCLEHKSSDELELHEHARRIFLCYQSLTILGNTSRPVAKYFWKIHGRSFITQTNHANGAARGVARKGFFRIFQTLLACALSKHFPTPATHRLCWILFLSTSNKRATHLAHSPHRWIFPRCFL